MTHKQPDSTGEEVISVANSVNEREVLVEASGLTKAWLSAGGANGCGEEDVARFLHAMHEKLTELVKKGAPARA